MSLSVIHPLMGAVSALVDNPITNAFGNPATAEARAAAHVSLRAFLTFLPFIAIAELGLIYVMIKFRKKKDGRKPATFHENILLETVWTILPIIALATVAVPELHVLRFMEVTPPAATNITVVGHQFFWEYKYPGLGIDIANEPLVVPADQVVDLDLTSVDVIHGWYVPALGIQEDAVPGRITTLWFNAKAGTYKGQCTQLCGALHGEMFIDVKVLPRDQFDAWVKAHQASSARLSNGASVAPGTHGNKTTPTLLSQLMPKPGTQEGNL